MAEYRNRNRILYPLGVTQEENGVHIMYRDVPGRFGCSCTGQERKSHARRSRLIRNTGWEMCGSWHWIGQILHHLNTIS